MSVKFKDTIYWSIEWHTGDISYIVVELPVIISINKNNTMMVQMPKCFSKANFFTQLEDFMSGITQKLLNSSQYFED